LRPELWSDAPRILEKLFIAGAIAHGTKPLASLLSQVYPFPVYEEFAATLTQSQNAWIECFNQISSTSGCSSSEQWLHVAQMPEYVSALLDSDLLPAGAAVSRDPDGISVVSKCAFRASLNSNFQEKWLAVILRLLEEPGNENAASEIVALGNIQELIAFDHDVMWPCPVLRLALQCRRKDLLSRSLTQSTIDVYNTWKAEVLSATLGRTTLGYSSLIYKISKLGASTMEEALQRDLHFSCLDLLTCHDGIGTQLGPVGCLALSAAESADETEQVLFGRLAAQLLHIGMDDPQALVYQNGAQGGIAELVALITPGAYLDRLTDAWFAPMREWLGTRSL